MQDYRRDRTGLRPGKNNWKDLHEERNCRKKLLRIRRGFSSVAICSDRCNRNFGRLTREQLPKQRQIPVYIVVRSLASHARSQFLPDACLQKSRRPLWRPRTAHNVRARKADLSRIIAHAHPQEGLSGSIESRLGTSLQTLPGSDFVGFSLTLACAQGVRGGSGTAHFV